VTVTRSVERLVKASAHLGDPDLDKPYAWEEYNEDGLRFALLTAHHQLRDAHAQLVADLCRHGIGFERGDQPRER